MAVSILCLKHVALLSLFFLPSVDEKVKVLKTTCILFTGSSCQWSLEAGSETHGFGQKIPLKKAYMC